MSNLQTPERAMLSISIKEISNGFIATRDGRHTFFPTYGEAFASLSAPLATPQPKRKKSA